MGGCVISTLSAVDTVKQVQNPHITAVRSHGLQSVETGAPTENPESRIRRCPSMKEATLEEMYARFYGGRGSGANSLVEMLEKKIGEYGSRKAMAFRSVARYEKSEIEENGKKKPWELIHLKPTEYLTYSQMWEAMMSFGRGLRALGFKAGDRFGLYEETRYEWMVSLYGAWSQSMTGVTVYANLGEDALEYAIREAELPVMVCGGKAVKTIIRLCKKGRLPVPTLIHTDAIPADCNVDGVKVVPWSDVVAKGRTEAAAIASMPPTSPDEIALIMYTSGTTGDPKGVLISHGNVLACVQGLGEHLSQGFLSPDPNEVDAYVAYLPLAHILEFAAENVFFMRGMMVGYGNPRTLTNAAARPHGDFQEFRPTLLVGVPRIFDTIKKAVESKLPDGFKRRLFQRAFDERKAAIQKGLDTPFWDSKVFAVPRQLLGGRVRAIMSGGAPMSAKTQQFLTVVFGCSVGQGYGLTETVASCSVQRFWDTQCENIGALLPSVEVKLRDVDEFKHTDKSPRGEICIRGPVVTKGYYKQPEKTAEAYGADGWFYTGDVGEVQPDGTLKIVGRVKALAKNAFGEYVALDALESIYVMNELALPNGVCVLVDSQKAFICALVLTDEAKAMKFAKRNGIEGTWPTILQRQEFQARAAESFTITAKSVNRKPFEIVKYVRVLNDEWTPENGVLTAAMKLKRRVIDDKYADLIKELFTEVEASPFTAIR